MSRVERCWGLCLAVSDVLRTACEPAALVNTIPSLVVEWLGVRAAYALFCDGGTYVEGSYPTGVNRSDFPLDRALAARSTIVEYGIEGECRLAAPLLCNGKTYGVIAATGDQSALDSSAMQAMDLVSIQMAKVLAEGDRARLGAMAAEWTLLQRIDAAIRQADTVERAMDATLRDLAAMLASDQALFAMLDDDGEILHSATLHPIGPALWSVFSDLVRYASKLVENDPNGCLLTSPHLSWLSGLRELSQASLEVGSLAVVPLHLESIARRGVLVLLSAQTDAFTGADLAVIRRVAVQVASSLDHIIMSEQLGLFLDLQETLVTISRALQAVEAGGHPEAALHAIVESVVVSTSNVCGAALHLARDGDLILVSSTGPWPGSGAGSAAERWAAAVRHVWLQGKPAQIRMALDESESSGQSTGSLLVIPLSIDDDSRSDIGPLGVLSLLVTPFRLFMPGFSSTWLRLAEVVARTISNIEHLARLEEDKTRLEQEREAILRSRSTLEAVFDSFPFGLFILDGSRRVVMRNSIGNSAPVGVPCFEALPCRGEPCRGCRLVDTLSDGRLTKRTVQTPSPDGGLRQLEVSTYPVRGDSGTQPRAAVVTVQDVTRERKLAESLVRVEKFTAIGRLASSIAHEINNPLTIVMLNADLLEKALERDEFLSESAGLIARGAKRASQVVRNLQRFSRDEEMIFSPTNLRHTVDEALTLVSSHVLRHGGWFTVDIPDDLPLLMASAKDLEQVWATLILSDLDMMLAEGSVGEISMRALDDGDYVVVTISRPGRGLPKADLSELFSPFGLPSLQGVGSGLGLYGCYQIVKQHGGTISGRNALPDGFIFEVRIPKG